MAKKKETVFFVSKHYNNIVKCVILEKGCGYVRTTQGTLHESDVFDTEIEAKIEVLNRKIKKLESTTIKMGDIIPNYPKKVNSFKLY